VTVVDQDSRVGHLRETVGGGEVPVATSEQLLKTARKPEGRAELVAVANRPGLTTSGEPAHPDDE